MNEMVAYCGLICQGCPIYWATRETDEVKKEKMKTEIVRICKEQYGYGQDFVPEYVTDCDGCRTDRGRLFSGCEKCEIRNCARQRALENCAICADDACEKLQRFFVNDLNAKSRLDVIRSTALY